MALTRDPSSRSAARLAALPGVRAVKADDCMDAPAKCFDALGFKHGDVYGVFSNQGYVSDARTIAQGPPVSVDFPLIFTGSAIADATKALGVQHIVFSSSDFGGLEDSGVATFEAKRTIENHIKSVGIPYSALPRSLTTLTARRSSAPSTS